MSAAKERMNVLSSGKTVAFGNATAAALAFAASLATARVFGDDRRGLLSLVLLWPTLLVGVASLGLPHAAQHYAAKDPERAGQWVGSAAVLAAIAGAVVGAVGVVAVPLLLPSADAEVIDAARWAMLTLVALPVFGTLIHPWIVLHHVRRWVGFRIGRTLLTLIPALALGIAGSAGLDEFVFVQLGCLGLLLGAAVGVWRSWGMRVSRAMYRPLVAFGATTALATIPFALTFKVDQLFIAASELDTELSVYVVAAGWSALALPILNVLAHLTLPRVVDSDSDPETITRHVRFTTLVVLLISGLGAAVSPFVVPVLYGQAFEASGRLAMVLLPATGALGMSTVTGDVFRALGRPGLPLISQLVAIALTLSLLPFTVPEFGITGAAWTSAAAYGSSAIVSLVVLSVQIDRALSSLVVPRRSEFATLRRAILAVMPGDAK